MIKTTEAEVAIAKEKMLLAKFDKEKQEGEGFIEFKARVEFERKCGDRDNNLDLKKCSPLFPKKTVKVADEVLAGEFPETSEVVAPKAKGRGKK